MFVFGRREETKAMRNIAGAPGIFNINEPLSFGLPIILNPIYFIPWMLVPMVTMTVGYVATVSGFADPVIAAIPWVTPIGLSAFLATGGSIGAVITQLVCVVLSIIMWAPFLIASERQADKQYGSEKE
jgi:PTS system cellobiose-specific IIC component